ncbi:MAG TPA: TlyA family rRNA (cytidine-2'-O)-methyltransferase [Herpetosiphon sp.]|uniref:Hemolysin A n=1 Tax=Herpetosiphon aurantiacus (strain ATCC 23779 / DSM 785 / 114-95) TaxID=316274 RepID=A9AUP2_HERA2|nr:TlyA family RNA methyltransferase [Herpetosiphon sp.]ABX04569.1 hemolysin A [Herpetosiphon aurantiacus DSM 785]HBW50041.1 TlyA family rRNA (cytidine-2'-O)-methyltransferase [Herpetosiphon sp.]
MTKVKKHRLDVLLVELQLAPTRAKAQALIMAGEVIVNSQAETKAGTMIDPAAQITLKSSLPYVGRGGLKLAHALDSFNINPQGCVALDVGACTGGFSDVLLQRDAAHVYAIDVGYGQLDWKIRQDPRVTVLERTNIRYLEHLPHAEQQPAPLATCGVVDVSFISLGLVLPAMLRLLTADAWIVCLIKPQFEAGPEHVGKGGIVRDSAVHRQVIERVAQQANNLGLGLTGLTRSPITGAEGNIEFLGYFQRNAVATIALPQALIGLGL